MTLNPYSRTSPHPAPLTPGEFGRAWVESLYWTQRPTYEAMLQQGTLYPEAQRIETEAQAELLETMQSMSPRTRPKGMLPDEALGAVKMQARELILASVRHPEPDETPTP